MGIFEGFETLFVFSAHLPTFITYIGQKIKNISFIIYFKILKEFGEKKWVFGHKLFLPQKGG